MSFGSLLLHWRKQRHLSQLALATLAGVSTRHVCFIETGRASPSRDMVLLLARALDVPLRERNALLLSAGFAPSFTESALDAPQLSAVRGALDAILRQQEPFPAVVMDRWWDVVGRNQAAITFFAALLGERVVPGPANVLRTMFHPHGARPHVTNWEDVAQALLARVQREAVGGTPDKKTNALLAEILRYPGVPQAFRSVSPAVPLLPIVPVSFALGDLTLRFFSTVTTFGTPQDVTAQELRIECFFPVDAETERAARELLSRRDTPRA